MRRVGRQGSWNLWDPGQQTVGAQRGLQPLGNSQSQGRVHNWGLCFPCLGCRTDMESIRQFQKLGEPGRAHKLSCSLARETQVCGGGGGGPSHPEHPGGGCWVRKLVSCLRRPPGDPEPVGFPGQQAGPLFCVEQGDGALPGRQFGVGLTTAGLQRRQPGLQV